MTKPSVYLETSVIGYVTSRPSRDLVVAARQQITRDWFGLRSQMYELFVSQLVAFHGVDYLLTWNCKHIANATMRQAIERACIKAGYEPPIICTPEELMDDKQD